MLLETDLKNESQRELAVRLLEEGYDPEEFRCAYCGMIYDEGIRCAYCGSPNPLNDGIVLATGSKNG